MCWWMDVISYSAATMVTWVSLVGKNCSGLLFILSLHSPLTRQGPSGIQVFLVTSGVNEYLLGS